MAETAANEPTLDQPTIKYCVCAMIDLLGFSSHLEISSYDLRTSIGQQAVKRLENLETILDLMNIERKNNPRYYPENFAIQRINDAIFFSMDLDDFLIPTIGSTNFQGLSIEAANRLRAGIEDLSETDFKDLYERKISDSIDPLIKFVGLISRVHIHLNKLEGEDFFPGAKTVISTGIRRPFVSKINKSEDYFSANFALSNAYIAEKNLHGANIFIDSAILQLVSFNKFAKHAIRFAHYQFKQSKFDFFENHEDNEKVFMQPSEPVIIAPVEIKLFRKDYSFINLNPAPLTYLQNIPSIMEFLNDSATPDLSNIYYRHIFNALKFGIGKVKGGQLPPSFLYNGTNHFDIDISLMYQYLTKGNDKVKEEIAEKKFKVENGHYPEELQKKLRDLENETVKIDVPKLNIEEMKPFMYNLNEHTFSSLLIMLDGDVNAFDYKKDS